MDAALHLVTVARRTARAFELPAGATLRIIVPAGGLGGDFTFLGFDQSLTRNIAGWEKWHNVKLTFFAEPGMKLYDGDGVPYLEVVEVHSDLHIDIMYPGCWREIYADGRPGCRDLMAQVLGVTRRQITGMASYFVRAVVDAEGYMFDPAALDAAPGDYLRLRALRPVTVGVSACPDDTLPGITRLGDLLVEVGG